MCCMHYYFVSALVHCRVYFRTDYLGTENNDDEKTRDMEDMITRALTRLSQDRSGDTHDKPFYSK